MEVTSIVRHLSTDCMGRVIAFYVDRDKKRPKDGRVYLQCIYEAPNSCKEGLPTQTFRGRKWYLSDHMLEDEIVKTAYAAFKATIEHEIMEGFRYDGKRVFNPHADFRGLMNAGKKDIYRTQE